MAMREVFRRTAPEYAVEAFDLKALHDVLKPMTEQALKECLNRLEERQGARRRVHIISSFGIQQMLYADEIQYAQSSAHYYDLHLKDGTLMAVLSAARIAACNLSSSTVGELWQYFVP